MSCLINHYNYRTGMFRTLVICLLSLPAVAYNGYVKHRSLAEIAESVNFMLEVEIIGVSHELERKPLFDGSLGPVIFEHVDYVAVIHNVLYGDWQGKSPRLKFRHSFRMPFHYDRRGNNIGSFTPVVAGSGLEPRLRTGVRYVAMFTRLQPNASQENRLVRAETAQHKAQVQQLVHRAKARLRKTLKPQ
jgi:hypothetical protein